MQEAKTLTRPSLLVDVICAKIVCAGPEVYYSKLLCCHRYIPVTQLNHCLYSLGIFSLFQLWLYCQLGNLNLYMLILCTFVGGM